MPRKLSELKVPEGGKLSFELALALIIRERREELGLSQESLESDDVNQSQISKLERGKQKVYMPMFVALAKKLEMEPWDLLREVAAMVEGNSQ
ncbi:MAG: helix-turn-helix transcriptional regulator ['Candidatus Kapabacteria' thiocyanatum]|uniref:HTH cro/C1-type domain-containing protein n=1 Tax=Candidatus Kapaibacterium thiocyanatum TaxID=1895771 RepID=A0A1M3L3M7_9BACT|nr:helix-turn-helix transcriptional regulator ['Candidatus Kapabacteria' thiocyanatum]OJX59890.1 MAG: hypothetical protein BGO89_07770 ['Candidatus Kapabacteria' thiocyanatum]